MKKLFLIVASIVLATGSLFSAQTFDQSSAIQDSIYYGVPAEFMINETGSPTDFYITIGDINSRDTLSRVYGWGEFNPPKNWIWTPEKVYTNVRLGIHTATRNDTNFSVYPTDSTDIAFDVKRARGTLELREDSIWYNDNFLLNWNIDERTVPNTLILQYRTRTSGWTTMDTVTVFHGGASFVNTFIEEDVRFRLTYEGSEYGYNIARTDWIEFKNPTMTITNRNDLNRPVVWKDGDTVNIEFETDLVSEYSKILVFVYEGRELVKQDTLKYNATSYQYILPSDVTKTTGFVFYTSWDHLLNSILINSENKYFELSPVDEEYTVDQEILFDWSASLHFETVQIEVFKNGSQEPIELVKFWDITESFRYVVLNSDTTLQFRFTVEDKYSKLEEFTRVINIVEPCREDELLREIDVLNIQISKMIEIQDSLEAVIVELENMPHDTVIVLVIKDITTSVEEEYIINIDELMEANIQDRYVELPSIASNIYIIDTKGSLVQEDTWTNGLYLDDSISSGVYILAYIIEGKTYIYKFVKI